MTKAELEKENKILKDSLAYWQGQAIDLEYDAPMRINPYCLPDRTLFRRIKAAWRELTKNEYTHKELWESRARELVRSAAANELVRSIKGERV